MEFKPLCLECENYEKGDICKVKDSINIHIKIGDIDCSEFEPVKPSE